METISPDETVNLQNQTCPFCGEGLHEENSNKEHLIGRRFVPKGTLHQSWNLILMSCKSCNEKKGDLEDDISAITMQPDPTGRFPVDHEQLKDEARRKSEGSYSEFTGKLVEESDLEEEIVGEVMGGLSFSMGIKAPPQIDRRRCFNLAAMQLQGFFYWITYDQQTKRGHWWPGGFAPVQVVRRGDWGNELQLGFMSLIQGWEPRIIAKNAADGFYQAEIRKQPGKPCWAFGIEWNVSYRLVGFFGEKEDCRLNYKRLPELKTHEMGKNKEGDVVSVRTEVPLNDEDDLMFEEPHES